MENTDDSYEEEETLLYVEYEPTSMDENQLRKGIKHLKLFGLETKEPLLQISNRFFQGEFDLSMGTHVFLEKIERKVVDELYCKCESYYNYSAKTSNALKVSRVLLKDKAPDSVILPEKDIKEIKNQLKIAMTYEETLNKLLAQERQQPRNIAKDFNSENLLTKTMEVTAINKQTTGENRD